jgi:hypothetical protein
VEGWPTNRELSQNMVRGGGRSEWNRTYFFNPACQSETTLIADVPGAGRRDYYEPLAVRCGVVQVRRSGE